MVCRKRK